MRETAADQSWFHCYQKTVKLATPILSAHLIEALIPFINTTMAAWLGQDSLAAVGLVGSTFLACMGFCWGVIASVGIMTAAKIGEARDQDRIGLIFWAGLISAAILTVPIMILFRNMESVWIYFGQDRAIAHLAQFCLNGLLLGVFADLAKFAIGQYVIACNMPRIALIGNIVSVIFLIPCNYFFIKYYGICGIGIGTALTYWLLFIAILIYLLFSKHFKTSMLKRYQLKDFVTTCLAQFQLGIPIGLMFSIELLFFMVLTLLMGCISPLTLAANQIAMQWLWFTIMLTYGFTEAVTILVAKARGAGNFFLVKRFTSSGIMLAFFSMLAVACLYWFLPRVIISIDLTESSNPLLMGLAVKMLLFCGIYQILDSVRIVISGALRGLADSQYPMWITAISFWLIGLPLGAIFAFNLHFQEVGLWFGMLIAAVVSIVFQYFRLQLKVKHERLANEVVLQEMV